MNRYSVSSPGRIASAVLAIACTFALHGGWLAGMDRDVAATLAEGKQITA